MRETDAAVAANRFGLGARPGEIRGLGREARGALRAQLSGAAPLITAPLPASYELLAQTQALRSEDRQGAQAERQQAQVANAQQAIRQIYAPAYAAEMQARFRQATASERSFLERLVHFWSNHFAVSVDKLQVLGIAGAMERE